MFYIPDEIYLYIYQWNIEYTFMCKRKYLGFILPDNSSECYGLIFTFNHFGKEIRTEGKLLFHVHSQPNEKERVEIPIRPLNFHTHSPSEHYFKLSILKQSSFNNINERHMNMHSSREELLSDRVHI